MKRLIWITLSLCIAGTTATAQKKDKKDKKASSTEMQVKPNVEYTTASGLKYKITEQGKGVKAAAGATVTVHYTGTLTDGKKFDSSKDRNQPFTFKLGIGQVIKGWDEGIALLRVGDKAILTIPSELGYGAQNAGTIPPNSTLIFEVELLDVKEPAKPWVLKKSDTLSTASGLQYIYVEHSKSDTAIQAASGKTVSVHYTGFLTDGKVFDSSVDRGEPISFPLGQGRVIRGWDEGIALMKVGDKMRLIIPPHLGYGERGAGGVIPPNAILIFDVELMKVQ